MKNNSSSTLAAPTRVLFLNDLGFQYGAGVAQARQVQSLLEGGFEVGAIAWEPGTLTFEQITTRSVDPDLWLGLKRVRHLDAHMGSSEGDVIAGLLSEAAHFAPDIIIVGNLHAAKWPLRLLPALRKLNCRVLAYMHDGYLFTGRCPYPGDCDLYKIGCDHTCPTATEYPVLEPNLISGQWRLRREIFNGELGVEVVANSIWTRDMFRSALQDAASSETVYLAADEEVFKPGDKARARAHLGLPSDKPIVLCAAVNFEDKRKGAHYMEQIVAALGDVAHFVAFGHQSSLPGVKGLGYRHDPHEIALIYQASDVFLGTAVQEAFGQTIMEAQLCGVPVIAFQTGGVAEIVRNEITGKMVPVGDVDAAINALQALLNDAHVLYHSGAWARQSTARRFSLKKQADSWKNYLTGTLPRPVGRKAPDLARPMTDDARRHRPSWSGSESFLSADHEGIFERTKNLEGWQLPGDSFKLYEMGFHAGDVILEIGMFGGRSATVELLGALANPARTLPPQFYGIDISREAVARTRQILADRGLIDYSHLFEGTFTEFTKEWSITPTMVFLDGDHRYEGAKLDMLELSRYLAPETPVLVHDFLNPENETGAYGVKRAANEWEQSGAVRFLGCFGCSALFVTTANH